MFAPRVVWKQARREWGERADWGRLERRSVMLEYVNATTSVSARRKCRGADGHSDRFRARQKAARRPCAEKAAAILFMGTGTILPRYSGAAGPVIGSGDRFVWVDRVRPLPRGESTHHVSYYGVGLLKLSGGWLFSDNVSRLVYRRYQLSSSAGEAPHST